MIRHAGTRSQDPCSVAEARFAWTEANEAWNAIAQGGPGGQGRLPIHAKGKRAATANPATETG